MAIPALDLDDVLAMNLAQRCKYFEEYARYMEDAPTTPYVIRVGGKTLYSDDTMDLKIQFYNYLKRETFAYRKRQIGVKK